MNTWKPIETAPKDGTEILVAWPIERWKSKETDPTVIYWSMTVVFWDDSAWNLTQTGSYASDDRAYANFTHWMPLPEWPSTPSKS